MKAKRYDKWTVALRSSALGLKRLGTIDWVHLAGPVPLGALVSPYEPRIAIVLQHASGALHGGDPMDLDYYVMGAHLERGFPKKKR